MVELARQSEGRQLVCLADELKGLGFAHEAAVDDGWGDLYKWVPTAPY